MTVQKLTRHTLTFLSPNGDGEIEVPILGEVNEQSVRRAARHAFYSLVHAGYGDLVEIQVYDSAYGHVAGSVNGLPL